MKKVLNIIRGILVIILFLSITAFGIIQIASSTILSKNYILKQLEEANYYENIHKEVESDFEKYIYQSGLDETVINNIISIEDIKKDTELIISNIYDGKNEKIDVTKIKEKLNKNINESLNGKIINKSTQKAIDEFVNKISEQYIETMSHTNFEKSINNAYVKIQKYKEIGRKVSIIAITISSIGLLAIMYKKIFGNIALIGISLTASGMFNIFINIFINSKVKINNIIILNESISIVIRNILNNILSIINQYGYILLGIGLAGIIIGNTLNNMKKQDREKNEWKN